MLTTSGLFHDKSNQKSFYSQLANVIGGPASFLELHPVKCLIGECKHILGAAFSLILCFVFIFMKTENPTSHLYVDVRGTGSKILAFLGTGYSDEMLINNEDNAMHLCVVG